MKYSPLNMNTRVLVFKCPHCQNQRRVRIPVHIHKRFISACPVCQNKNYINNQDGALEKILRQRENLKVISLGEESISAVKPAKSLAATKSHFELPPLSPQKYIINNRKETNNGTGLPIRMLFLSMPFLLIVLPLALFFIFSIFPQNFSESILKKPNQVYLNRIEPLKPNRILDRQGKLLAELFDKKTGTLTEKNIPDRLKMMLLFVEDRNFYQHQGVQFSAIVRAFFSNLFSFKIRQGGSTISQQLARILLNDFERSLSRKIRELSLSYILEGKLSKNQILAAYMNHVYLGHGAYGFQQAAHFYFGKSIQELNFTENLILACLPPAPEIFSPLKNPRQLVQRMDAIFRQMAQENFQVTSPLKYEAQKKKIFLSINRSPNENVFGSRTNISPYVTEYVRQAIIEILGEEYEYNSGLVIETTLDTRLQEAAQKITGQYMARVEGKFYPVRVKKFAKADEKERLLFLNSMEELALPLSIWGFPSIGEGMPRLECAAVGVNPWTGEVLFMQGGREFSSSNQMNRALQMYRQTGSAIKPVIYSAAFEEKILTPASLLEDAPLFVQNRSQPDWLPQDYDGIYEGKITARRALAISKNIPAIRVMRMAGRTKIREQFARFFFPDAKVLNERFRNDESIAIGSLEMNPLEMAVAFSAFGNNGMIMRPYLIKRIVDSEGRVLYQGKSRDELGIKRPKSMRVIPGDVAEVVGAILQDAARSAGVYRSGYTARHMLGKTGTSNDFSDAWFVGVLPGLAMAVWVGYDDAHYAMHGGCGSCVAAPLWGTILKEAKFYGWGDFYYWPRASRLKVCRDTGLAPCDDCQEITELFVRGTRPENKCQKQIGQQKISSLKSLNLKTDFD
jgi:penicillin-binding protein 1A